MRQGGTTPDRCAQRPTAARGGRVGSAEVQDWGAQANRHAPELETFDRFGRRVDEVRFHPAYHELMRLGLESRLGWEAKKSA